jgi:hypothetical protein
LSAALVAALGLAAGGCYPDPDDLRRPGRSSGLGGCLGAACSGSGNGGSAIGAGSGGSTGSDAGVPPALDTTAYANAFCDRFAACAPTRLTAAFGSLAVCQTRFKLDFDVFLALPDTGWTAAAVAACAAATRAQSCADFDDDKIAAACNVAGKRATGQACATGDQCASVRCAGTGACGTCAPRLAARASCSVDGDCAPPLVCTTPATGTGTCVMPVDLGGACDPASAPCRYSLSCRDGACATPGAANVPCEDFEDCDDRHGLLCDFSTLVCAAASVSTTICGAPASNGNVQYCPASGYCSTSGTCLAAAPDNRPCSSTGPLCTFPAACINGTCTLPAATDCR